MLEIWHFIISNTFCELFSLKFPSSLFSLGDLLEATLLIFLEHRFGFVRLYHILGFPGGLIVKNLPPIAGDIRDTGLIPGSGRSPGGGHGSPLQYSCLENLRDKGVWRATLYRVAKSRTWPKQLSMHAWAITSFFSISFILLFPLLLPLSLILLCCCFY